MKTKLRSLVVALFGVALLAPLALASKDAAPSGMRVADDGDVFAATSVAKAESKFDGVAFKSPTYLNVHTFKTVPAGKKADFDKVKGDDKAKGRFFHDWATELSQSQNGRGVFVLVSLEGSYVEVISDRQTDLYKHFGDAEAKKVRDILLAGFKDANGLKGKPDEQKVVRGEALEKATDYVISKLKNATAPEEKAGTKAVAGTAEVGEKKGFFSGIWGWLCIGVVVVLGIWVVVAVVRAFTGNVGGGYGYGGYGGYGGGGGGFFSSFMAGMFGAAAGMWMYDSFFNHGSSAMAADTGGMNDAGGDYGAGDTGAGDFDGGGSAGGSFDDGGGDTGGGGDWGGGDAGGGDFGGGDFGGGDFGGGGDR